MLCMNKTPCIQLTGYLHADAIAIVVNMWLKQKHPVYSENVNFVQIIWYLINESMVSRPVTSKG